INASVDGGADDFDAVLFVGLHSDVIAAKAHEGDAFPGAAELAIGDAAFGAGSPEVRAGDSGEKRSGQHGAEEFAAGEAVRFGFEGGMSKAIHGEFLPEDVQGRRPRQKTQVPLGETWRGGSGYAAQFFEDRRARAGIGLAIVEQLVSPVRA